jgi:biopolymer transport protein ExbD
MNWKVRHAGSPKVIDGMTLQQVITGLIEGKWETTDEVMGPGETKWTPIENHPQLAAIAEEVEPRPEPHHDEESHLDMNALIDVCLVLLIFFILTISISVLQSRIDAADVSEDAKGQVVVTQEKVDQTMIKMAVKVSGDKQLISVENKTVLTIAMPPPPGEGKSEGRDELSEKIGEIESALKRYVGTTSKTQLLLDVDPKVPHGTCVHILAAAKRAGMKKVSRVVP